MPDIRLDRQRTALLIADFYADMMGTLPHALQRGCLARTQALQRAARAAGILVCYSATVFRDGYPEVSERNRIFSERKHSGKPAIPNPLDIIHSGVCPLPSEPVVGKHRVNAFHGTDLQVILRARDIDTLILLGYATSGVVLSSTRHAADHDYRLYIAEDCCADADAAVHDFLCTKIFPRQAAVVQSAALIAALTG